MIIHGRYIPAIQRKAEGDSFVISDVTHIHRDQVGRLDLRCIVIVYGLLSPVVVYMYPNAIAFIVENGSWNSHGVVMASSKNIPCIVSVGAHIYEIPDNVSLKILCPDGQINF